MNKEAICDSAKLCVEGTLIKIFFFLNTQRQVDGGGFFGEYWIV